MAIYVEEENVRHSRNYPCVRRRLSKWLPDENMQVLPGDPSPQIVMNVHIGRQMVARLPDEIMYVSPGDPSPEILKNVPILIWRSGDHSLAEP